MTNATPKTDTPDLAAENARLRAELQRSRDQVHYLMRQATTDELTGLLNRRGFLQLAEEALLEARSRGRALTMIYIDVDGLKKLNDERGHEEGDGLLVETAALLQRVFRTTDVVARIGGDEFVVLTRDFFGNGDVIRRRIADVSSALHRAGIQSHLISLSAGVIVVDPYESPDLADLLNRADEAMYSIKQGKSSRHRVASEERKAGEERKLECSEAQQNAA